jgi:hypothetical protein
MTFSIDGQRYRIGFQHDKPKDWGSHIGHCNAEGESSIYLSKDGLYCGKCRVWLSGISPAIARRLPGEPRMFKGQVVYKSKLVARELARNVGCIIYRREGDQWVSVHSGRSRLNTDAGDQYERESGRIAALRDALPKKEKPPEGLLAEYDGAYVEREQSRQMFCEKAMDAYLNRARRGNKAGAQ